jgi:hypothetical protein
VVFNIEQLRQACTTSNQLAWRRLIQLKELCSETAHQIATQVREVDDPCAQVKVIRAAMMEALLTFVGKFRPRCSFVLGEPGLS